jgi:hypothetical protein
VRFVSARPTLAAAVIYAVLSVLMVGQGLLPGRTLSGSDTLLSSVPWQSSRPADVRLYGTNFELADSADVFQPMLQYTRSELPGIPLWNPYIMAGRPLLADGQSAVLSPFSIPAYLVGFWKSLAVSAILKLFLGAFGAYLLGRMLGMRFGGALLTGLVFAFGTFFVVWLAWPLTSVYAFIPWALLLTEALIRAPGAPPVAGLAAVIGLQFLGGHPESSFHLLFVTAVFFVFRVLLRWRRSPPELRRARALVRPTVAFVIALGAGAGLAAVLLAPFAEFLFHSADLSRRTGSSATFWPRQYLGALFLHDYWGRPTQVDLVAFIQNRGWYAGAATLMLAAVALLRRRTAERIAVTVFALFCLCMVIGIAPVFGVVSSLPGFSAAHNERLLIYFLLCLALLAGWGLDELSAPALPGVWFRRLAVAGCAAIFCVPIAWLLVAGTLDLHQLGHGLKVAWGFVHPPLPAVGTNPIGNAIGATVRDSALLIWLPLAGAALVLIWWRLRSVRRLPAVVFVSLMVLLVAADLFRANMGFNPAIPIRNAVPPATGAIRYLQSQRPNRFIGINTKSLSIPLPSDLAMHFGLYDARGYDFPVEKHFDALWRGSVAPTAGDFTQPEEFADATPASLRALDLLSVSDVLLGPSQAAQTPPRAPGLRVVYRGRDGVIYANDRALPRVFVVDRQRTVGSDPAALAAVIAPGFDGRGVAVTQSPVAGIPQAGRAAPAPAPAPATARLTSYRAQRVQIQATAAKPSLLVLTDSFYPGWKATVDGRSVPVRRVDYLLRGVSIGPGRHTVVFSYQPSSWTIGWVISLLTLLALLAAVAVYLVRRRQATAA